MHIGPPRRRIAAFLTASAEQFCVKVGQSNPRRSACLKQCRKYGGRNWRNRRFGEKRARGATKHQRLTDWIIADIESGVLAPGTRLPPHPDLAHRINVSAQTVSVAYKQAEQLGYLSGQVGRGTFVRPRITELAGRFMLDGGSRTITDLSIIQAAYSEEDEEASHLLALTRPSRARLAGC
jgi:DNA-binding transcriptional regulator YhcF (GntR family)